MRLILGLFVGLVVNIAQAQPGDPPTETQDDGLKLIILGLMLIFIVTMAVAIVISDLFRKPQELNS